MAEEKKDTNEHISDGKEYFYHLKIKQWRLVLKSPTPARSTPTASTPGGNIATPLNQ